MYTVYALKSEIDGRIYVGFSSDTERRLREHNSGKTKSTKGYRPWTLIFTEQCATRAEATRAEAREREKFYKSGRGKEILKRMVP